MKIVYLLCLFLIVHFSPAQEIPPYFFSQNAWMPDTLGNIKSCPGKKWNINCKLYGKIHKNNTWQRVAESGVKLVRFGGEHVDENMPTLYQYLQMVDSIRAHGMEPLLQVPYNNNYYTYDTALMILKYINVTMKRNVKYWSIGNEPDLKQPYGYGYYSASPIADYIRQFASKMKELDSTIITVGPELKFYNDDNRLVSELCTPGGFSDITGRVPGHTYYYLDVFSFHTYPFGGEQTRENLVSNLRDPWHISNMLDRLNAKLDSCNIYHERMEQPLRIALTETNVNYRNSKDPELNAHSFIAGQFWCELMGVGMEKRVQFISFWSIVEASLGYIDEATGHLWPTYHHYKLMAENFKGRYCMSRVEGDAKYLKVIAAADEEKITVMLLNQKAMDSGYSFSIQMGRGKVLENAGLTVRISNTERMGASIMYRDYIQDESTSLLVFDHSGKLLKKYEYKKSDGMNAVPRLVPAKGSALFASAGPDVTVKANQEIVLGGKKYRNATCRWYVDDSMIPLNVSSSSLKVMPVKSTTYRLVVTYPDCVLEDCVQVKVE